MSKALDDAVKANPDLAGIFGTNLFSAQGAAAAVKDAGKTGEIKIVGFDAFGAVPSGDRLGHGPVEQNDFIEVTLTVGLIVGGGCELQEFGGVVLADFMIAFADMAALKPRGQVTGCVEPRGVISVRSSRWPTIFASMQKQMSS